MVLHKVHTVVKKRDKNFENIFTGSKHMIFATQNEKRSHGVAHSLYYAEENVKSKFIQFLYNY